MIKTLNVEAEHNELVLKNNHGDYVIIPADKRDWVKTKLAEGCNPCIDSLVESLPIMDDYAEDGTVVPNEPEKETKKEITPKEEEPIYDNESYSKDVQQNYQSYLDKTKYTSPIYDKDGINTSKGSKNCIYGVCDIIKNTSKVKLSDDYIGNVTFNDNAEKEGFYKVDPNQEDFEGFKPGDIYQYSRFKSSIGSRFDGKINHKNIFELTPNHAVQIVDKKVNDKGETMYTLLNNKGGTTIKKEDISEADLLKRYREGYDGGYDGGIVMRYDPKKVKELKQKNTKEEEILSGNNEYASQYEEPSVELRSNTEFAKQVKPVYEKIYSELGKSSNIPKTTFDKLMNAQIGIAGQETEYGKDAFGIEELVPKGLIPSARGTRNIIKSLNPFSKDDNWKLDYWKKNADGVQDEFNTYSEFLKEMKKENNDYTPNWLKNQKLNFTPISKGVYQQKQLSQRGERLGYDLDTFEGQTAASLALAVDNYHTVKNKYPDLSEDELVDLTILMHNAPSKAMNKRFVNYYLKNNDINYVNKVKEKIKPIEVNEPIYQTKGKNKGKLLGRRQATTNN